jgi:hypothetical protein
MPQTPQRMADFAGDFQRLNPVLSMLYFNFTYGRLSVAVSLLGAACEPLMRASAATSLIPALR